jgi:hypothetical protein
MSLHAEGIQTLCVAYFGRPADVAGLNFREDVITRANGGTEAIAEAFSAASEYRAIFNGFDENGIVDVIYHQLFHGQPKRRACNSARGLKAHAFSVADQVTAIALVH